MIRRPPRSKLTDTLFPYTTLFRSLDIAAFFAASPFPFPHYFPHCLERGGPLGMGKIGDRHSGSKKVGTGTDAILTGAQIHSCTRSCKAVETCPCLELPLSPKPSTRPKSEERSVGKGCVITCSSGGSPYH